MCAEISGKDLSAPVLDSHIELHKTEKYLQA